MRRACEITAIGLGAAEALLRPGVSEREVANAAHAAMFAAGAEELGFDTAVSSGPRAGLKHAAPTERRLQGGELVFLDMGAVVAATMPTVALRRSLADRSSRALHAGRGAGHLRGDVGGGSAWQLGARHLPRRGTAAAREGFEDDYMPNGLGHGLGLRSLNCRCCRLTTKRCWKQA